MTPFNKTKSIIIKMATCYYYSYAAQVYQWTHLVPWIVPLAISAASIGRAKKKWGKQVTLVLYGTWLSILQLILLIVQSNMNRMRADPYCPDTFSAAYPCVEAFYVCSLTMFIIGFTYIWNVVLPWPYWTVLFLFIAGPPSVLIFFQYNTLAEILVSGGIGIGTTIMFLLFFAFVVVDMLPYLMVQAPFTWFYCIDNYAMNDAQIERAYVVEQVMSRLT